MKSLYKVLQESIFDDGEEILDKVESNVYSKMLLDNILNAKSFKEYEQNILELQNSLDEKLGTAYKPNQKPRFKKDGIYMLIVPKDYRIMYKTKDGPIDHSHIHIGKIGEGITFTIDAVERTSYRRDCIENGKSYYELKTYLQKVLAKDNVYIYKIDGTDYEGMLDYMKTLNPYNMNLI